MSKFEIRDERFAVVTARFKVTLPIDRDDDQLNDTYARKILEILREWATNLENMLREHEDQAFRVQFTPTSIPKEFCQHVNWHEAEYKGVKYHVCEDCYSEIPLPLDVDY